MPQYHVSFEADKKILTVASQEILLQEIISAFSIETSANNIQLQVWATDWDDWVNTSITDIPEKAKIKVVVRNQEIVQSNNADIHFKPLMSTNNPEEFDDYAFGMDYIDLDQPSTSGAHCEFQVRKMKETIIHTSNHKLSTT